MSPPEKKQTRTGKPNENRNDDKCWRTRKVIKVFRRTSIVSQIPDGRISITVIVMENWMSRKE